ncbi:hypothetical protein [Marinobacter pelagius]|uniref:Uncharacterized protein n=1 Tax=Marinobacter pelagius TaxID=379482 RepID=A0A1I4T5P1_9GAMM|nr:hypothetical protein [Marinobacter pelagius]SFM71999.1 hypothetical protein SAMN04487961_1013 [Marinobacter pelagius]
MNQEHKPTANQLLASWQLIWTRVLAGKPAPIKEAIASHVQLFPKGNQSEVRSRVERLVNGHQSSPHTVKGLLARGKATLRRV